MDVREAKAKHAVVPKAPARSSPAVGLAYGRFLELPPVVVLAVFRLAGSALLGSIALGLYLAVGALLPLLAGPSRRSPSPRLPRCSSNGRGRGVPPRSPLHRSGHLSGAALGNGPGSKE